MKYHQGFYHCKNPQKYIGNADNIVYRSGLELKFMQRFDRNSSILAWGSEELSIPYFYPVDKSWHKYFIDFVLKVKRTDGSVRKILVEIKPSALCKPPKKPKRMTKAFVDKVHDYIRNQSKWKAARNFCELNGYEFVILTENDLKSK